MGPVRQNPIQRTVSLFICVCVALCTIVAHNIAQNRPHSFPLTLQTITTIPMMSIWGKGGQRSEIGCLPYFHTWCGLSANLESRSEMCCTWLAENTGRKNDAKNRHLGTIPQLCRDIFATEACIDNWKKNLLSSNISSQYGELWPSCGWDPFVSLGHPR